MRGNPSATRPSLSSIVCLAPHAPHTVGRWYGAEGDDEASDSATGPADSATGPADSATGPADSATGPGQ